MKYRVLSRIRAAGCCAVFGLSVLLAGCATAAGSSSVPSSQSLSEAPASQAVPSGDEDTLPAPNADLDDTENGFNGITDPAGAFSSGLGWGPGTAGTSLKSVAAAASMMDWAQENGAANRSASALRETLSDWYNELGAADQENFAEAWPLIEEAAQRILDNPDAVAPEMEDAGVQEVPDCSADNWSALAGALDAIVPAPQQ